MKTKIVSLLALLASVASAQNPNTAAYPSAVATDTELLCWNNSGTTTLNGAINNSTLTVVVTDASNLCAPGVITVDSERMKVASISTNTLTIASGGRGFDNSSAASHSDGAAVNGYVPAYWLNQIAAEIKAIQTKLTANMASTTFGAGSSITHTFDASGGTDCTAVYGDNTITFTCGTVTFGSGTGTLGMTEGTAPGAGSSAGIHNLYFRSDTSRLCSHENGSSEVCYTLGSDFDSSSELAAILADETGSGAAVFGTSPTVATPVLTGKIDRNNVSVDDDDCTGEQGLYWYDTTDSAFEFCNANSGTPTTLGGGATPDYVLLRKSFGLMSTTGSVSTNPLLEGGLSSTMSTPSGGTNRQGDGSLLFADADTEILYLHVGLLPSGYDYTNISVTMSVQNRSTAANDITFGLSWTCFVDDESTSSPADLSLVTYSTPETYTVSVSSATQYDLFIDTLSSLDATSNSSGCAASSDAWMRVTRISSDANTADAGVWSILVTVPAS